MHNSPIQLSFDVDDKQFRDQSGLSDNRAAEWISSGSSLRLRLIALIFCVCSMAILARIAWVKVVLPEKYLAVIEATTTEYEVLPARDGRILAGSTVLATDVEQYTIEVHFRWLQEPADRTWLRQQVRARLSRSERSDSLLVSQMESEILAERERLKQSLLEVTAADPQEFEDTRKQIQDRVQRIADSVNRRADKSPKLVDTDNEDNVLIRAASAVRHALTSAPAREADDRIVVLEEESWHAVFDDVALPVAAEIREHPERFPGTRISSATDRIYPQQDLAAHVVGARTARKVTDLDFKPLRASESAVPVALPGGLAAGSLKEAPTVAPLRIGRFGVEMSYDQRLSGSPGVRRIVRDRRRQIISDEIIRNPQSGHDVTLTLNVSLQQTCEQLLAEALTDRPQRPELAADQVTSDDSPETTVQLAQPQPVPLGGSIVVMEAATGHLIAAASAPGFDLQLFTSGSSDDWQRANQDQRHPFISRFTGMALPPGSTFKTVTAIAALETGTVDAATSFLCRGFLQNPNEHRCLVFRNFGRGHGAINLKSALAQSCNVYFFDAATRMGIRPLADWTDLLEFGHVTGVDLPFEKSGTIPVIDRTAFTSQSGAVTDGAGAISESTVELQSRTAAARRRFEREALGLAIGQSRLTATPLQMARMMAAVVNGGYLVTPRIVSDEGTARRTSEITSGESEHAFPRTRIAGLKDETLAAIRDGLVATVENPAGTGYKTVRLPGSPFGGKTGTAETSPGKPDHAWFAGFAPADDPQYVFIVVLEHGGSGSHAAGPIAREVVRALFDK